MVYEMVYKMDDQQVIDFVHDCSLSILAVNFASNSRHRYIVCQRKCVAYVLKELGIKNKAIVNSIGEKRITGHDLVYYRKQVKIWYENPKQWYVELEKMYALIETIRKHPLAIQLSSEQKATLVDLAETTYVCLDTYTRLIIASKN